MKDHNRVKIDQATKIARNLFLISRRKPQPGDISSVRRSCTATSEEESHPRQEDEKGPSRISVGVYMRSQIVVISKA